MDTTLFLQHLRAISLEEGRAYIQTHISELAEHHAIGDLLADEALKQLYDPFPSLKLAEMLIFLARLTHEVYSHALSLRRLKGCPDSDRPLPGGMESLDAAGESFTPGR